LFGEAVVFFKSRIRRHLGHLGNVENFKYIRKQAMQVSK